MLYRRTLFFIHSRHTSLHLLIPNFQSTPLHPLSVCNHPSVLYVCHLVCFKDRFIPAGLDFTRKIDFVVVQSLSHVWLFVTPWTEACQASLSITVSWSLLKFMSIELVMPSNHLILCCPLLFLPSIFPSIRVFFQWVSSSHQVAIILKLKLQQQCL